MPDAVSVGWRWQWRWRQCYCSVTVYLWHWHMYWPAATCTCWCPEGRGRRVVAGGSWLGIRVWRLVVVVGCQVYTRSSIEHTPRQRTRATGCKPDGCDRRTVLQCSSGGEVNQSSSLRSQQSSRGMSSPAEQSGLPPWLSTAGASAIRLWPCVHSADVEGVLLHYVTDHCWRCSVPVWICTSHVPQPPHKGKRKMAFRHFRF